MARFVGVAIAVAVILILFPFMPVQNGIVFGLTSGGITLLLLVAIWLNHHLRKLSAIKSAAPESGRRLDF